MPSASSQKQIPLPHCVISTQTHSKAQGSMYHDEPIFQRHPHQQPQRSTPVEVATTLWPQQTTNYWFPNWRELFYGFTVVQGRQPRHAATSSFERNWGVTSTQQHASSSPSPCYSTQCLHDDPTQSTHHVAPSAQQQQISSLLPSSATYSLHSRLDDATPLPHPCSTVSHTAVQSSTLPLLEKMDQTQKGDARIARPPSWAPGLITKYTIKSPFWLPQGWVTEIQMRGTGTTADKFYKHLVSGRRFRSRNEVSRYISTGKGRTRKRDRRKKSLALTASHSLMNNFAHKKHTALAASKLLSSRSLLPSTSETRHPTHLGIQELKGPKAELRPNGETGPPSKQPICFSASSSIRGPESLLLKSKQPAQEKPQKLPIKKKAKTIPLKKGEDKQTSNILQWFKQPGVEKKTSEMADQRNGNDMSLKDTASQRTVQLGREIQAAHKTVVQMSREMQATVEKLSREIREAQKDVASCSDLKLSSHVLAEMEVASINKTEADRICRDNEVAPGPCMMTGSVVQASHWLHVATNNLPQQAKWPDSAVGYMSHVVQKPVDTIGILKQGDLRLDVSPQTTNSALHAITREKSFALDCMRNVTQPAIWPDVASHQGMQPARMAYGSHSAKRHVETSNHATQPAKTASATIVNRTSGTQAAQSYVVAPIHIQQSTEATVGDVTRPALWPGVLALNVAQPTQIAYIEKGSNAKAAERCALVDGYTTQPAQLAHLVLSNRTEAPQRHVVVSSHSTQPAEVDCVEMANVEQAAQRQTDVQPTTERPISSIGHANAPIHNPAVANALGNVVPRHAGGAPSNALYATQEGASCGAATGMQAVHEEVARRRNQDRKARRIRRKKFAAVLNPKLDLSRLNPALTARQRAKAVQRLKTRHARELLATLGLHLCRKAIRRKPRL